MRVSLYLVPYAGHHVDKVDLAEMIDGDSRPGVPHGGRGLFVEFAGVLIGAPARCGLGERPKRENLRPRVTPRPSHME
jgi:hypothetical protein